MKKPTVRTLSRYLFYVSVVALVLAVLLFQHYMDTRMSQPKTIISGSQFVPNDDMSTWDQKGIDVVAGLNSLLTTLGTAVLGAIGFLLWNVHRKGAQRPHMLSALLGAMCVALSLYFGFVGHLHILWWTETKSFSPGSVIVMWPHMAQFYTLLLGAFFLADFAVYDLSKEDQGERLPKTAGD